MATALIWVAFGVANAGEQEPPGARAFVENVYKLFPENPHADPNSPRFNALFETKLADLIKQDRDGTPAGDVGLLDFDPFCQCQDTDGLRHQILSIDGNATDATVKVRNSFKPPADPSSQIVTYRLVRVGTAWRINDIVTDETPSFRSWLADGLKSERSAPR